MRKFLLIIFSVAIAAFAGCQPGVRFTSDTNTNRTSIAGNASHNNSPLYELDLSSYTSLSPVQEGILKEAQIWMGTPYCYGGDTHTCTDCSGFTKNIYSAVGINLPRTAADQYLVGTDVRDSDLNVGDLVFFKRSDKISHVGIYIGNGEFIHASTSNGVVRQSLKDAWYQNNLAGFRRFININ
ncbi:MAG: C40 family peptidase [FCB group bacterium]|jgi:cell wall-associated NlpC family hydrolase